MDLTRNEKQPDNENRDLEHWNNIMVTDDQSVRAIKDIFAEALEQGANFEELDLNQHISGLPLEYLAKILANRTEIHSRHGFKRIFKPFLSKYWLFEWTLLEFLRVLRPIALRVDGRILSMISAENRSHHCALNTILCLLNVIPAFRQQVAEQTTTISSEVRKVFSFQRWCNEDQMRLIRKTGLDPNREKELSAQGFEVVEVWKYFYEQLRLAEICHMLPSSSIDEARNSQKRFLMLIKYVNCDWNGARMTELPMIKGFLLRCVCNVINIRDQWKHVYLHLDNATLGPSIKVDEGKIEIYRKPTEFRPALLLYERCAVPLRITRNPYFELL